MAKADEAADLKEADLTMAVVKGTTSENFVKELLPELKRIPVADADEGTNLVANGKAKAMLTDFPICLSVMNLSESHYQRMIHYSLTWLRTSWFVRKMSV